LPRGRFAVSAGADEDSDRAQRFVEVTARVQRLGFASLSSNRLRLLRVRAPVALLAACAVLLPAGLVLPAVCRRPPRAEPIGQVEGSDSRRAVLHVCSDSNNLPFSNLRREGVDEALAEMRGHERRAMAGEPDTQRNGSGREWLVASRCDVIMGVPTHERVLPIRPRHRSTYVLAPRAGRRLSLSSIDDSRLRVLRVGQTQAGCSGVPVQLGPRFSQPSAVTATVSSCRIPSSPGT
jgi:hypothetical protein